MTKGRMSEHRVYCETLLSFCRNGFNELLDALSAAQAELERVKEQVRWRPVSEKPSERGDYLVIWNVDGTLRMDVEYHGPDEWVNFHSDNREIVFWMPLPEPPKGEGK